MHRIQGADLLALNGPLKKVIAIELLKYVYMSKDFSIPFAAIMAKCVKSLLTRHILVQSEFFIH